jgi:hypothetical protein
MTRPPRTGPAIARQGGIVVVIESRCVCGSPKITSCRSCVVKDIASTTSPASTPTTQATTTMPISLERTSARQPCDASPGPAGVSEAFTVITARPVRLVRHVYSRSHIEAAGTRRLGDCSLAPAAGQL